VINTGTFCSFLLLSSEEYQKLDMGNLFCCVQVGQSTVAVKEKFGKYSDVLEPGCHCVPWFLGSQLAGHVTLRLQQLDVRCETKTKVCIACIIPFFFFFFTVISFLSGQNKSCLCPVFPVFDNRILLCHDGKKSLT
jgi:hypothetical protein